MSFLNQLKTDKNARKVFGQRELKIIEKQLLGISLTQSEKNRLSRDIRKKLEFIEAIAPFKDDFKLKKGAVIKDIIKEAKEAILNDPFSPKVQQIILFGSAVRNELSFRSDIDIAIKFTKISQKEGLIFRKRILGRVPDRVDIQVFNNLPDKIKIIINKEGRIIFNNEGREKRKSHE